MRYRRRGTTDLSLFSIQFSEAGEPHVDRIAVSDHILLGGDNIDLALAKIGEPQLTAPGTELPSRAWQSLVNQCRTLKERALGEDGERREEYHVSVSDAGSHLFTETKTAVIRGEQVIALVNEGFFPFVQKTDRPLGGTIGLREMGLPYAKDSAVTRYLADFLFDHEEIDAVLFNGGTLTPLYLQKRIQRQIAQWQENRAPVILENSELYLAVARGAAHFGKDLALKRQMLISAAASHGFYLEVNPEGKRETAYVVCILPQGTNIEAPQKITKLDLQLLVNQPVSFRPYSSVRRRGDHAGQILKFNATDFRALPPLETYARLDAEATSLKAARVPVSIEAQLNALGLLQVALVGTEKTRNAPRRWELEFNLRKRSGDTAQDQEAAESFEDVPPIPDDLKKAAFEKLNSDFSLNLLKELEYILHRKKDAWNRIWLRSLWEPLFGNITRRQLGPEYEAAWLNAAGYFLRPGYGVTLDDFRIEQLWNIRELELSHPKEKFVREQYYIMWRRVSGGLGKGAQAALYAEVLPLLKTHVKQANEPFQMASTFELLPQPAKSELLGLLLEGAEQKKEKHCEPYLWALGRLLSRVPLYAGEDAVMPPAAVEECFRRLKDWDWKTPNLRHCTTLVALACRKINSRTLDVPPDLRAQVIEKMIASGAKEHLIEQVRSYLPVKKEDLNLLFGETLPAGLAVRFRS